MNRVSAKYAGVLAIAVVAMAPAAGGRVSMTLSGGKTGSVEMRDAGFCVTSASLGTTTMHIFAFGANNKDWAITITSSSGMPKVGSHTIDPSRPDGVTAGLIDKTTGTAPIEWVRYEATAGTVTLSRADSAHVAGSFKFPARPTWPKTDGKVVTADGTFEATTAEGCNGAPKGRQGDVQ